jgi:hypothetical protein
VVNPFVPAPIPGLGSFLLMRGIDLFKIVGPKF